MGKLLRFGASLGILVAIIGPTSTRAGAVGEQRPDLGMAPISEISITKLADGRRVLRFSATIVNVGSGPFDLTAVRSSATSSDWSVSQRVRTDAGWVSTPVPIGMVFGGDGHGHWHVRDLEVATLDRLDNGSRVGTGAKVGFCFFDGVRYGDPVAPAYSSSGCGVQASTSITMGLSVGWGDVYPATLPDQFVDITNLAAGRYRLTVTADHRGLFAESDETNNGTWVELQIKGQGQPKIIARGPAA